MKGILTAGPGDYIDSICFYDNSTKCLLGSIPCPTGIYCFPAYA